MWLPLPLLFLLWTCSFIQSPLLLLYLGLSAWLVILAGPEVRCSWCTLGRKVEMGTDSKMLCILDALLPPPTTCTALPWLFSYGTVRAAWQTYKGWGLRTPMSTGAGGSINAGGGQLVSVETGEPELLQRGLVSIFFQQNGTLGTQKPSEILNMAASVGILLSLTIARIHTSRHNTWEKNL